MDGMLLFFFAELSDKAKLGCLSLKSLCQELYEGLTPQNFRVELETGTGFLDVFGRWICWCHFSILC